VTLDELASLPYGPDRDAYPTHGAYDEGWYLWRALRRERRLTLAEENAALDARIEWTDQQVLSEPQPWL